MKRALFVLAAVLSVCGINPATAADAPFGCGASKPDVCHFRIFYARGDRIVVLPAGMESEVPGIKIGTDRYCMSLTGFPAFTCKRKLIDSRYNG
jgi:hypothetical protein